MLGLAFAEPSSSDGKEFEVFGFSYVLASQQESVKIGRLVDSYPILYSLEHVEE